MKRVLKKIKSLIRDCYNIFLLFKSDLFNKKYYRLEIPNYKGNLLMHYYKIGYLEGKNPSESFDNDYYLEKYKDVRDANINPLVHYLKIGKKEKRKIRSFKGLSIQKIIRREYDNFFFYKIHFVDNNDKINVFVENLDKLDFKYLDKLKDKYKKDLIIYYKNKSNNYKLNSNIKYIRIDKYYYINVSYNDVIVCYDFISFLSISRYKFKNIILDFIERKDITEIEKNFINSLSVIRKKNYLIRNSSKEFDQNKIFDIKKTKNIIFNIQNNFALSFYLINEFFLSNKCNEIINISYINSNFKMDIELDNGLIIGLNNKEVFETLTFSECEMLLDK